MILKSIGCVWFQFINTGDKLVFVYSRLILPCSVLKTISFGHNNIAALFNKTGISVYVRPENNWTTLVFFVHNLTHKDFINTFIAMDIRQIILINIACFTREYLMLTFSYSANSGMKIYCNPKNILVSKNIIIIMYLLSFSLTFKKYFFNGHAPFSLRLSLCK